MTYVRTYVWVSFYFDIISDRSCLFGSLVEEFGQVLTAAHRFGHVTG